MNATRAALAGVLGLSLFALDSTWLRPAGGTTLPATVSAVASSPAGATASGSSAGAPALHATSTSAGTIAATSCLACHSNADAFDETEREPVERFKDDVHARAGLSCEDCHGGDASLAVADDTDRAMDPKKGFAGAPGRRDIPAFCGRCHSDPVRMKRYKPEARVDQEREYHTSVHGKRLAAGDEKVATCIDCHGAHGILPPSDSRSPVYPTHVAETCAKCHADRKHMDGYKGPDGGPLPTDQYLRWRGSVHATALLEKGDLSAPTCNDCHGNHGATPPGFDDVAFVCGACHGREADLFRASGHHVARAAGGKGAEGCPTCHTNHGIVRPTVAMLAPLPETPCAFCHEGTGPIGETAAIRKHYESTRDGLLAEAARLGLDRAGRFDWLVDRAEALPFHRLEGEDTLRPEFARLFSKFRIGKTQVPFVDRTTGAVTTAAVVRCSQCHDDPMDPGAKTAAACLDEMRELTAMTGRAERTLLAAKRGGVEIRSSLPELDAAVGAQIELEALVHGFSAAPESAFAKKQRDGLDHARKAIASGNAALGELAFRRRGLGVSLVFVLLFASALVLKIRSLHD